MLYFSNVMGPCVDIMRAFTNKIIVYQRGLNPGLRGTTRPLYHWANAPCMCYAGRSVILRMCVIHSRKFLTNKEWDLPRVFSAQHCDGSVYVCVSYIQNYHKYTYDGRIYVTVNLRNQLFPGIPNPLRESGESLKCKCPESLNLT